MATNNGKFVGEVFKTDFVDDGIAVFGNHPIAETAGNVVGDLLSSFVDFSSGGTVFPHNKSINRDVWEENRRRCNMRRNFIAAGRSFDKTLVPKSGPLDHQPGRTKVLGMNKPGKGMKKGVKKKGETHKRVSLQQMNGPTTVSRAEMNRIYAEEKKRKQEADQRAYNRKHPVNRYNNRNGTPGAWRASFSQPFRTGPGSGIMRSRTVRRPAFATVNTRGQGFMFASGSKPGSIRIRLKQYMGTLVYTTTGTTTWTIANSGGAANCQYYFNPTNQFYVGSGLVQAMSRYFDEYRVNYAGLEFTSAQSPQTAGDYQITWCMCESVDHWEKQGVANGNSQLTKLQIASMPSAMTFSVWEPSVHIDLRPKTRKLFTACNSLNALYDFSLSISMTRQTYAFTAGMVITGTIPAANVTMGDLWMWVDFELWGMNGQETAGANLFNANKDLIRLERSIESKYGVSLSEIAEFKKASSSQALAEQSMAVWNRLSDPAQEAFRAAFKSNSVDSALPHAVDGDIWRFKKYYLSMDDINRKIFIIWIDDKGPLPSQVLMDLLNERSELKYEKVRHSKSIDVKRDVQPPFERKELESFDVKTVDREQQRRSRSADPPRDKEFTKVVKPFPQVVGPDIERMSVRSQRSDDDDYSHVRFDKTLGYPGEGPYTCSSEKLKEWVEEAMLAKVQYHAVRGSLHDDFTKLLRKGGDYKMSSMMVGKINSILTLPPARFLDPAHLQLTSLLKELYDELDDDEEEHKEPGAGQ